jgi:hypothetical protein
MASTPIAHAINPEHVIRRRDVIPSFSYLVGAAPRIARLASSARTSCMAAART